MLPLLATTVKGYFPARVEELVVSVSWVCPLVGRLAELKRAWAPGIDEMSAVKFTVPVMPPSATVLRLNTACRVLSMVTPNVLPLRSQ